MQLRRGLIAAAVATLLLLLSSCSPSAPVESEPPLVKPVSVSESEALYSQYVEQLQGKLLAAFPAAEIPAVDRVRTVRLEDWAPIVVSCLKDQGFDASVMRDGGIQYSQVPEDQNESLSVADYICSVQYPIDPIYLRPLDAGQIEYLYDYYLGTMIPCLEKQGFLVGDVPSKTTFSEEYSENPWSPYSQVDVRNEDDWFELNKKCPQTPAQLFGGN